MGSEFREPRPKSAERLAIKSIDHAEYSDGAVLVKLTVSYDTWCCGDYHEVLDGIIAVSDAIYSSADLAQTAREDALRNEYAEVRAQLDDQI
jgi:hypothetical protein